MKELHGQALGVWTIGGAELGGNRNTDQSREPQRVRGGQRGTHRRQKTGPCDSGQPLGPPDSAASSGTWALVGRLRQGGSSQAPPGPARTPTTPPPSCWWPRCPWNPPTLTFPPGPLSSPHSSLLLDSRATQHAFLPWGLGLCYSSSQESTHPCCPLMVPPLRVSLALCTPP